MSLSVALSVAVVSGVDRQCIKCGTSLVGQFFGFLYTVRADGNTADIGPICQICIGRGTGDLIAMWQEPQGKSRVPPKSRRRAVTKQEVARSEELGGQRQTGSGSRITAKGDGRVFGKYRIECKSTTAASFTVKLADLNKIRSECAGLEVPLYEIEFWEDGTLRPIDKWVLVPWDAWKKKAQC